MGHHVSSVSNVLRSMQVIEGAGVRLNRMIGTPTLDHIDPFVLLDEFRSDNPDDYLAGFPWHPHRGIETVTYMIEGRFRHQDSKGGGGVLTPGTVQWMTAGRGILHSEMPDMSQGLLWGYQLWLSLPRKDKMVTPRYQHLTAESIPRIRNGGATVILLSGTYEGVSGPAMTWFPISYFDVRLEPESLFQHEVDKGLVKVIYAHTGSFRILSKDKPIEVYAGNLVLLDDSTNVEIKGSSQNSGFLFLAGTPLGEPIVRSGPFVMNTQEEIHRAWEDLQSGRLF